MASGFGDGPGGDGDYVDIDGSQLEGGGQILRMATVFSALLKRPIHIYNIRGGRSKPGLRPQHLMGIRLIRDLTKGKLKGDNENSTEIWFSPSDLTAGDYFADTKTAGGFYPKGGGEVIMEVSSIPHLNPITLTNRGDISSITGRAWVAGSIPERATNAMRSEISRLIRSTIYKDVPLDIAAERESDQIATGTEKGTILIARTTTDYLICGSALGKRGSRAEAVAVEAAENLVRTLDTGGSVDNNMQDQLIVFMALANGTSQLKTSELTLHAKTAIYIAELMSDAKFTVETKTTAEVLITCAGIGYTCS